MIALQRRNYLETQTEVTSEERDADLILRLEQLLIDNQGYINIEALRENFQITDNDKSGKIDRNEVLLMTTNIMRFNVNLVSLKITKSYRKRNVFPMCIEYDRLVKFSLIFSYQILLFPGYVVLS